MKINRRIALASLGALVGLPAKVSLPDLEADDDDRDSPESSPQEIADFCARQELKAIRFNHPAWWQKLRYTSIVQWGEGVAVLFGVGPAWYCQSEQERLVRSFSEDCDVLATAHESGYRSWSAVVRCNLSEGVRREVKKPMFDHARR